MITQQDLVDLTPDVFIKLAHKTTAMPSIIVYGILSSIIMLLVGFLMTTTSQGRAKMFQIWLIWMVFNLILAVGIILSPFLIQSTANFFS